MGYSHRYAAVCIVLRSPTQTHHRSSPQHPTAISLRLRDQSQRLTLCMLLQMSVSQETFGQTKPFRVGDGFYYCKVCPPKKKSTPAKSPAKISPPKNRAQAVHAGSIPATRFPVSGATERHAPRSGHEPRWQPGRTFRRRFFVE